MGWNTKLENKESIKEEVEKEKILRTTNGKL